ncbi:GNAT family N-acetyltransferase [Bacteroidia bacterium]|jgi:predicted GNAT family N-acyltransferase|nr:GNAT family N-acetyltransferase [Bacteroidia bacterium]
MGKSISVKLANTIALRKAIFEVRREVFVKEQEVNQDEEYDQFDTSSIHLAALVAEAVVGTCRYRNTEKGTKLERFAVLREYRSMDIGENLLLHCLSLVQNEAYIYLHAQIQVVDFYTKYGFEKQGDMFEEAGIRHYKMVLRK